ADSRCTVQAASYRGVSLSLRSSAGAMEVLLSGVIAGSDSEPDGARRSLSTALVRLLWLRPAACSVWPAIREIFLAGFVWEGILSCDGATGRDVDVLGILRRDAGPE
ncbi:hypothetical protein T484DRAFT_1988326, partial [Baffinella frigidus]